MKSKGCCKPIWMQLNFKTKRIGTVSTTDQNNGSIESVAAVDHDDSDYEVEASDDDDDVEMDDYTDEAAVPVELSDDVEIELKSDGQLKKATLKELKQAYAGQDYIQKGM